MIEKFKVIGKALMDSGLSYAYGGSLSILDGDKIIITKKDVLLSNLKESDLTEVPLDGTDKGDCSVEIDAHRSIYKSTQAKAVVQAHPANSIALSISENKIIPQDSIGMSLFRAVPIVRVNNAIASSDVLRILPSLINGNSGVAMVKAYCSFAFGQSLEEALKLTSALEISSDIVATLRKASSSPQRSSTQRPQQKRAIPPSIGVMDRSRRSRTGGYRR